MKKSSDVTKKITIALRKKDYDLCIELIENSIRTDKRLSVFDLTSVLKKYGSHLIKSDDISRAIEVFTYKREGVLLLDPSYVINKFSALEDLNKKQYLIEYLLKVHEMEVKISKQNTKILLGLFLSQIREGELKLDDLKTRFLNKNFFRGDFSPKVLIKILRRNGQRKFALEEAYKQPEQSEEILEIELSDYKTKHNYDNYRRALIYIEKQVFAVAKDFVFLHGRKLLYFIPGETTNLFLRIIFEYKEAPLNQLKRNFPSVQKTKKNLEVESFQSEILEVMKLFIHNSRCNTTEIRYWFMVFLESILYHPIYSAIFKDPSDKFCREVHTILFELYLKFSLLQTREKMIEKVGDDYFYGCPFENKKKVVETFEVYEYRETKESDYCSIQQCVNELLPKMDYKIKITNKKFQVDKTFIEMVFSIIEKGGEDVVWFDGKQVLSTVLIKYNHEEDLIIALYKKLKLYSNVIDFYKSKKAYQKCLDEGERYFKGDEMFWIRLLSYYSEECKGENKSLVEKCITKILEMNLFPPTTVLETVNMEMVPLKILRPFLLKYLKEKRGKPKISIGEIERLKTENEELAKKNQIFNIKFCSNCKEKLDFPYYCFFCKHSYHERCLQNGKIECQICCDGFKKNVQNYIDLKNKQMKPQKRGKMSWSVVNSMFGTNLFEQI